MRRILSTTDLPADSPIRLQLPLLSAIMSALHPCTSIDKGLIFAMKKFCFLLLTCLLCLTAASAGADVIISEIMTNNGVFIDGEHHDWIEIHNNGEKDVSLAGYGLSDSKKKPCSGPSQKKRSCRPAAMP